MVAVMKKLPYFFFDKIILRTPIFPMDYYLELTANEILDTQNFKEVWKKKEVREAIVLSSQDLYHDLIRWEEGKINDLKKKKKLERVLLKYLVRMSTRCTPFGTLAGISTITFNERTKIVFPAKPYLEKLVKPSFEYLTKVSKNFIDSSINVDYLTWFPNTTIYDNQKSLRYIECNLNNGIKKLSTESITKNKFILLALEYAKLGNSFDFLKETLINGGLSVGDSKALLHELIKNQVLVSNIEPNLTGKHYSKILNEIPEIASKLKNLENNKMALLNHLHENQLPIKVDLHKKTNDSSLSEKWKKEISSAINLFTKITTRENSNRLESFKREFSKRYGTKEMPLPKVLDVEHGINYLNTKNSFSDNSFISDFSKKLDTNSLDNKMEWSEITSILNKKVLEAQKNNQKHIRLFKRDFKEIDSIWRDLPTTMFSMVELVKIDENDILYINSVCGKTAAAIISRFSDISEINDLVQEITQHEKIKHNDKVLAEIVHVPSSKIANVLVRPNCRQYEIPYLAKSTLDYDRQIPISDLTIRIRDNDIIIKSSRLNKEIVPMLTCTHDYTNSQLAIYQFLCDVSGTGKINKIGFDWGCLINVHRYLPRVLFENVIISKARWSFQTIECIDSNGENTFEMVSNWRKQYKIPRIINLIDTESNLLINLENHNCIEIFSQEIKGRKWFVIEEVLSVNGTPVKNESMDFFANEFIISLGQK